MTEIHPSAIIDNSCVIIGKRCKIGAGTIIGCSGMTNKRDKNLKLIRTPSKAKVIIEDDVLIGENTIIQRGHTNDTIIGEGTHIIAGHIGHDSKIGKHCSLNGRVALAGYVTIGDYSYLGMGAFIKDGVKIGKRAIVGMAAVVTKDVPDNVTVMGSPAMRVEQFKEQRKKLESISKFRLRDRIKFRIKMFLRRFRPIYALFKYRDVKK